MADEDKTASAAKGTEGDDEIIAVHEDNEAAPSDLADPAPERVSEPVTKEAAPARRGGFVAPLMGGAIVAVAGFALSHFNAFGLRDDLDGAALETRLAQLDQRVSGLDEKTTTAADALSEETAAARAGADAGLKATDEKLAALTAQIATLEAQLHAQAEALPDGSVPPAAFAALKAEVEALKAAPVTAPDPEALRQQITAELDQRAAEVAARAEKEAEATRQAALRDAALIALQEAVRNGQPYQDALTALGAADVPQALSAHAETGLPGVAALTESFPDAARAALDASLRADEAGGFGDRALSLLRISTGARSLTPQEGTDPDAVLSRAEAAAKAGDLPLALEELKGLPPEGIAAMEAWSLQAQARIDAEAALAALKP